MSKEYDPVQVEFFFGPLNNNAIGDRISKAVKLLSSNGQQEVRMQVEPNNQSQKVTLRALVPKEIAKQHHNFDSIFPKAYPDGCGAGVVKFFPIEEWENT